MKPETEHNTLEPSGEFAASIRDFRSAVTHIAERETARPVPADWLAPARQRHRAAQHRMILGWACTALLCFATLPIHFHHAALVSPVAPTAAATARPAVTDTALLDQVDTAVSESVPSSLSPLTDLDNWDTTSTNTSGNSSNHGTPAQTEKTNVTH